MTPARDRLRTTLREERARLGLSQARLAEAAGVSRQSYAAIESGRAVPSTEVALRLAAALSRSVESLFRLPEEPAERRRAEWAGSGPPTPGDRVRLVRLLGRWVAYPIDRGHRPSPVGDGVVEASRPPDVTVRMLAGAPPPPDLVVVGCDPAFGIVADTLRRERGLDVAWSPRGSRAALEMLARGQAHVVGAHLHDPIGGRGNAPWIEAHVPFPCTRVGFAVWEQGLVARPSVGLGGVSDLARGQLRLINREEGSGSRMLLDEALASVGIAASEVRGYDTRATDHLAVAEAIASGSADVGVAIRAAGVAWGLDIVTLRHEAYELVVPDRFLDLPAVRALLDVLRRPGVRAQVEALGGYDGERMGLPG